MAETPPAPDLAAQLATLTGAVTALAESQKTVMGAVEKLATTVQPPAPQQQQATQQAAAATGKPQALTLEDVGKVVAQQLQAFQQTSQQADQRRAFIADKLKDLPPVYQDKLGNDPAKWAAEEQALRGQFREVLKAHGVTVPDVGGNTPASTAADGTKKPGDVVDLSKLNPVQLIQQGLQNERSAGGGAAVRTQASATAAGVGVPRVAAPQVAAEALKAAQ